MKKELEVIRKKVIVTDETLKKELEVIEKRIVVSDETSTNEMIRVIENLMEVNYPSFIKALICIEKGAEPSEEEALDNTYQAFLKNDVNLLNDFFDDITEL